MMRLRTWFAARDPRERVLLAILGGVALAALLIVAIVRPLQEGRGAALADIRTYRTLAARLAAAPASPAPPQRTGTPATLLPLTAAEAGLPAPMVDGPRATLPDAPYDAAIRWIAATEATTPLRLARLILRPTAPGRVAVESVWR